MITVTIQNVLSASYDDFLEAIMPYYNVQPPSSVPSAEADAFFVRMPSYYSYVLGLWSVLDHAVRDDSDRSQISKRDLADRALSAIKLHYEACSRRFSVKTASTYLSGERMGLNG